jgi:hypothetical protein
MCHALREQDCVRNRRAGAAARTALPHAHDNLAGLASVNQSGHGVGQAFDAVFDVHIDIEPLGRHEAGQFSFKGRALGFLADLVEGLDAEAPEHHAAQCGGKTVGAGQHISLILRHEGANQVRGRLR